MRLLKFSWLGFLVVAILYVVGILTFFSISVLPESLKIRNEYEKVAQVPGLEKLEVITSREFQDSLDITSSIQYSSRIFAQASMSINFIPIVSVEFQGIHKLLGTLERQSFYLQKIIPHIQTINKHLLDQGLPSSDKLSLIQIALNDSEDLRESLDMIHQHSSQVIDVDSKSSIVTYFFIKQTKFGEIQEDLQSKLPLAVLMLDFSQEYIDVLLDHYKLYLAVNEYQSNGDFFTNLRIIQEDLEELLSKTNEIDRGLDLVRTDFESKKLDLRFVNFLVNVVRFNSSALDVALSWTKITIDHDHVSTDDNLEILNVILSDFAENKPLITKKTQTLLRDYLVIQDSSVPMTNISIKDLAPEIFEKIDSVVLDVSVLPHWLDIAADIVGTREPSKYILLAHSADELRGTGGFVSAVWVLEMQHDSEFQLTYFDVAEIDDISVRSKYPPPPPLLEEHMDAWVWLMRDVSWGPDFTEVARSAQKMMSLSQNIETNGVIGFNQYGILTLLKDDAFMSENENTYFSDPEDFVQLIEGRTDELGREYLDIVLRDFLHYAINDISPKSASALFSNLLEAVYSKDIMIYSENSHTSEILSKNHWDGSMKRFEESVNFLYIVDANVGWSKVDRNIERDFNLTISFDNNMMPNLNLELKYKNHSGTSSAECEPQWIERGSNYSELMNSCYWNLFRVFLPEGDILKSEGDLYLRSGSVSANKGTGIPGSSTLQLDNYTETIDQLSGLLLLDAGENKSVNVLFRQKKPNFSTLEGCLIYEMILVKQPGVQSRKYTVKIAPPNEYEFEVLEVHSNDGTYNVVRNSQYSSDLVSEDKFRIFMRKSGEIKCHESLQN